MKIQLASDLHLEFHQGGFYEEFPQQHESVINHPQRDVLVLAGDIHLGTKADSFILAELQYSDVVYLLGNHEGYQNVLPAVIAAWRGPTTERINKQAEINGYKGRLYFLENNAVDLAGVRFLGGTLWTDFMGGDRDCMNKMQYLYNDYRQILYAKSKSDADIQERILWTPQDAYESHQRTLKFLKAEFAKPFVGSTIIVTHHAPSARSLDPQYREIRGGDASELDEFIEAKDIAIWMHGHIHCSKDYMIGNTRVICNPRGYWPNHLVEGFQQGLILEV